MEGRRQRGPPSWPQCVLFPASPDSPPVRGPGGESGLEVRPRAHADLSPASLVSVRPDATQEANSEKTNNGIHYRLQLLYSNGEAPHLGLGRGWRARGAAGLQGGERRRDSCSFTCVSPEEAAPEKPRVARGQAAGA